MLMKVERTLTSKGLLLYYSFSGNTKAAVNLFNEDLFDVVNIRGNEDNISFDDYDVVVIASSTWGRGAPPQPFFKIRSQLFNIKGKKIGLLGSGRSDFEYYCGALDLFEEVLEKNNNIVFKYKFEGYPKQVDFENIKKYIKQLEELL